MNDIIIAFVIPIITIILSVILETILRCPYKVAGIAFIALMITAFAFGGSLNYIILAWIYTFLAYIVAIITERIIQNCNSDGCSNSCQSNNSNSSSCGSRNCCGCRR